MILLTRIKTLKIFRQIIEQIKKGKFKDENVSTLSNYLDELKNNGLITNDYLEDVDVLFYVTNKSLLVDSRNWVNLSMNELRDRNSYNKMRDLVDELEANSFIHNKISGAGGSISFNLTYKDNFNKYIVKKIENKLEPLKIFKSYNFINKIFNFLMERIDQIVIAVIIGIILLIIEKKI